MQQSLSHKKISVFSKVSKFLMLRLNSHRRILQGMITKIQTNSNRQKLLKEREIIVNIDLMRVRYEMGKNYLLIH